MGKLKTGIDGLDRMLYGGVPKGSFVVLRGAPGSGKTTMGLSYLVNGAQKFNEPGVFISLEEPRKRFIDLYSTFNWDLKGLINDRSLIIENLELYDFEKLMTTAEDLVDKHGAKRLVIDPGYIIQLFFDNVLDQRKSFIRLGKLLKELDTTSIVTSEIIGSADRDLYEVQEYMADGLINLLYGRRDNEFYRTISVMKMRGTDHDQEIRPLRITANGPEVLGDVDIFDKA